LLPPHTETGREYILTEFGCKCGQTDVKRGEGTPNDKRPKSAIIEASLNASTMTSIFRSIGSLYQIIGRNNGETDWEGVKQILGVPGF